MSDQKSQREIEQEEGDRTFSILFAAFITIVMTIAIVVPIVVYFEIPLLVGVIIFLVYLILHILIGRVLIGLIMDIFGEIDKVFELTERTWGKWPKEGQMIAAAFWPIVFLPCFVVGILALVFGYIFKQMF
jgi:hypothetical protein